MITTKEQERKALEQIRKIVEGLGENSYVATAFKGCFEDAEENITNDFALSMYDRWRKADDDYEMFKARDAEHCKQIGQMQIENESLKVEIESLKVDVNRAKEHARYLQERIDEYCNKMLEDQKVSEDKASHTKALEQTIIELKAKLYDLMMK